jgi:cell division protein FtsB
MGYRLVPVGLIALLVIFHAQLWTGRGSMAHVAELKAQLQAQNQQNQQALMLNKQLAAEVRDLKEGLEMVEEKARLELGMVKANEILVHIPKPSIPASATR